MPREGTTGGAAEARAARARPRDEAGTGFVRKPMVRWLEPKVLADAALRVVLSSLFGAYADKREMQAFAETSRHHVHDQGAEAFWLDFVADLGDGFDATYAVACLLAREQLALTDGNGDRHVTPRGHALVMGGDQVYPSATRDDYENRFRGPYGAALPRASEEAPSPPGAPAPYLYAIPGNHDWYDGLTNFLRFFCSERWIGGWRTRQRRSYFALRLPHRWWVLGIDIQLDTYIDEPQLRYFRDAGLQRGDRVILVTGKPSWTKVRPDHEPDSYKNLRYFKDEVIRPAGAEVPITLTGDLHHYFRYEGEDGSQLVTAGGGGAFLCPTHNQPERLALPDARGEQRSKACYPSREESKRLARGALKVPALAPGLCLLIAVLDAVFAVALFAALDRGVGWGPTVAVGAITTATLVLYAAAQTRLGKVALGAAHAVAQLGVAAVPPLVLELAIGADGALAGLGAGAAAAAIGFPAGGVVFGLYLVMSHQHANDAFACQALTDYKCFLRLRIDQGGATIYPVGLRRSPRRWVLEPDASEADPWFRPADGELDAALIEPPVPVCRQDA